MYVHGSGEEEERKRTTESREKEVLKKEAFYSAWSSSLASSFRISLVLVVVQLYRTAYVGVVGRRREGRAQSCTHTWEHPLIVCLSDVGCLLPCLVFFLSSAFSVPV